VITALKRKARRLADLERELRRDQSVGAAPNPVRTEIFATHIVPQAATGESPKQPPGAHEGTTSLIAPASYNANAAKLASKNMINHYGTRSLSDR
jgi:hypothetical protein